MSVAVAIVMAPPFTSYPALPDLGEAHLFRREAIVRTEPCACGTDVRQRAGETEGAVVAAHQRVRAHRAWRERIEVR